MGHLDRRPMIVIGKTLYDIGAVDGKLPGDINQVKDHASHAYGMPMNGEYFTLAKSFENKYGVKFDGIYDGPE